MGLEKASDDRQNMQPAEHDWSGDEQVSLWPAVFARRRPFGFPDLFQNATAGSYVGLPGIRKRNPPTGPDEEARFQMRFQVQDLAADGCERQAELPRCSRQTAGIDGRK